MRKPFGNILRKQARDSIEPNFSYCCEDGVPDLVFPIYLIFYAWHYYCQTTKQYDLAVVIGLFMILTLINLVWITYTFQNKKHMSLGITAPKRIHPIIFLTVLIPALTTIPVIRQFLVDNNLAQLGVWVLFWGLLAMMTGRLRYNVYYTWAVLCYWVIYEIKGIYENNLLDYPYLIYCLLSASVPILVGSFTFLKYIKEYIVVRSEAADTLTKSNQ